MLFWDHIYQTCTRFVWRDQLYLGISIDIGGSRNEVYLGSTDHLRCSRSGKADISSMARYLTELEVGSRHSDIQVIRILEVYETC
jgi:hypothetical protein